ncbi:hypothetical protein NLI96_g7331 [Meripilus lineatus]|uniref:Uncharacterized protein n=1 Tax=Meripilus lineatus TaxID=2056292 RepID=A0AAD5UZK4_9APHY|nr:hypothetical protein NLI96_g7331 [Physisporinus lineatus]
MASSTEAESTMGKNDQSDHQIALTSSKPKARNAITKPFPVLHLDIVWMIMELVQRSCVLRLMESCRAFYSIGVPFLLRQTIHINDDNFQSFYNFLVAPSLDPSNRPKLVRELHFLENTSEHYPKMISRILSGAVHLQTLNIALYKENLAELSDALASLANIRNVRILLEDDVSPSEGLQWLKNIQSHIRIFHLFYNDDCDYKDAQYRAIPVISSLASTLTTLVIQCFQIVPEDATFVFPHVRVCRIDHGMAEFYDPPPAATFFKMFPELDALHLPISGFISNQDGLVEEYESKLQAAINLGVHQRRLKVLAGTVYELAFRGYICSVEKLVIKSRNLGWEQEGVTRLISQTRPSILYLSIQVDEPTPFVTLIIEKVRLLGPFKEMIISLDFTHRNDPILRSLMGAIPGALRNVAAETLEIACNIVHHDGEECAFLRHEFNMREFVLQIIAVAPKPRTITIHTGECRRVKRETFDVPQDLVERMRRTESSRRQYWLDQS